MFQIAQIFNLRKGDLMTGQLRLLRVFGLAVSLLSIAGAERAIASPYSIDILIDPYHPGIVDSWLFDINNQGQSTGYVIEHVGNSFVRSAIIYRDGGTQVLTTHSSLDINNLGDVIGDDVNFSPNFTAAGGTSTPIEIANGFVSTFASGGLNDSGNVLISTFLFDPADIPPDAYSGLTIWNRGATEALSVLDPLYPYVNPPDPNDFNSGPSSSAFTASVTRLNNANQFAAGIHVFDADPMDPANPDDDVFNESFTHAYIYDGQGGYSLLHEQTPGEEIRPIDIDGVGTVFGWAGAQLALWGPNGALLSVLPDPGTTLSEFGYGGYPTAQRNNLGQVVALTVAGGVLLYDPVSNSWTDITPSIDGLGTGTFSTIQGFNDLGQFVGLVRPPQGGGVFGYVVSPVPEPSSLAICGIALSIVVAIRHRKACDAKCSALVIA